MAKKGTTGGPRARRVTQDDVERRQQYRSRAEKERRAQRIATYAIAGIVVFGVILLVFALFWEQILVPEQAITTVNGDKIETRDFQERVRFIRWQTAQQIRSVYYYLGGDTDTLQSYYGTQLAQLQNAALMGSQVLEEMEEELLMKQAAKEMGIVIDTEAVNEEVDTFMAQQYGLTLPGADEDVTPTVAPTITLTPLVSPTPTNTPLPTATHTSTPTSTPSEDGEPTMTPTVVPTITPTYTPSATLSIAEVYATVDGAADEFYDAANDIADVDEDVVREVFYYEALRAALLEEIGKEVETQELQADVRHILIAFDPDLPSGQVPTPPTDEVKAETLARAEQVMQALQEGEPFADLAKALSDDTGSGASGGELGWASPEGYVENFKDAVLTATIGEIVGPIETEYGYHIIQVNGREIRPLSETEINSRQQAAFTDWLDAERLDADIDRHDDWLDRVPSQPTYRDLLGDILPIS